MAYLWTPGNSTGSLGNGRLQEAVDLCEGELLAGLDDEWVYEARELHRYRLGDVLERIASDAESAGALTDAIRISRRRVELDPLREDAHRELIRRLIAAGEASAARLAFDDLARRLRTDLRVAPSRETRRLLEGICAHDDAADPVTARSLPPLPPALARRERSPFVGRGDPLGWLQAQWSEAKSGSGRLAVIAGDPGIGKTRLASEFARAAREEGAAVLLGRCQEEVLISYQPFVEAFGRYVAAMPPRGAARPGRRRTGASSRGSFPSLPRRVPDLAEPAGDDSEGERFRLFEAAGALLANASRAWPVVLVLEDLHWADKPTALMLTTRGPLDPGGARPDHRHLPRHGVGEPLAGVLADLRRDRALERLRLGSLHRGEVATMISAWLGRAPPTHFAHAIHRETEGNPFFIEEVLRHLLEVAAADRTEWKRLASLSKLGIPDGVRDAIERRLVRLSADARRIVTLAAAIGRSFSVAVLEDLAEMSGEQVLEALEEAAERRIVEEEAGAPGRYTFAHALIRETLYASLSGPRRVRLHRRIGAIIEARHAGDPDPPLGELAYHFVAAAEPGAAAKAVDYSARAGRRALAALAYEEAVRHFDPRARGARGLESADEATRCELMLGLGESHGKASEFDHSRSAFETAAELARTAGLGEHLARAALGLGRGWIEQGTADPRSSGATGGARGATRGPYRGPGQAVRPPRHGASLRQRAEALPGAGAAGRRAGPTAGDPPRSRSRSTPITGPSAAKTKSANCSPSPTRPSTTLKDRGSPSSPCRAIAGASSTSSSSGGRRRSTMRSPRARVSPIGWVSRSTGPGSRGSIRCARSCRAALMRPSGSPPGIGGGRGGGQLERDHVLKNQLGWCWKDVGLASTGPRRLSASYRRRCSAGRCRAAPPRTGTATSPCSWPRPVTNRKPTGISAASQTATTPSSRGTSTGAAPPRSPPRPAHCSATRGWPRDSTNCCSRATASASWAAAASTSEVQPPATSDSLPQREAGGLTPFSITSKLETNTRAQAPPWIARSMLDLARALRARGSPEDFHRIDDLLRQSEPLARNMGMRSLTTQVTRQRSAIDAQT